MDWLALFSSSQYDLPLEVEPGSSFVGGVGYPDAVVTSSDLLYPRRILVQRMEVNAEDASRDRKEKIRIYRVAVETEDGDVVELKRMAVPSEESLPVDVAKCAGCSGKIPEGQHTIIDGLAYHKRCVEDSDGVGSVHYNSDSTNDSAGALGDNPLDSGSDSETPKKDGAGIPPEATPKTVTKVYSDDGISVSHMVTAFKVDEDHDIVTLWTRGYNGMSGTVQGLWPNGFHGGDLPSVTDVSYIDEKFFQSTDVVTATDLHAWNRLYKEAMRELRGLF